MIQHTPNDDSEEQTPETDDDFVTSQLFPLKTSEWYDGFEPTC